MTITTLLKESWKEDKIKLQKSLSLFKKEMDDYKEERKSNWKFFKTKFDSDLYKLNQSLKIAKAKRKKHEQSLKTNPVEEDPAE
jgi:hypothetical protein